MDTHILFTFHHLCPLLIGYCTNNFAVTLNIGMIYSKVLMTQ